MPGLSFGPERLRRGGVRRLLFQEPSRHAGGRRDRGGGLEETTTIDLKTVWDSW